ncbi:hypothetical protein BR141012304_20634 [Brucella inopinata]|nr:hypothetical protein BR141012304_20634 [Brucella inopinata]
MYRCKKADTGNRSAKNANFAGKTCQFLKAAAKAVHRDGEHVTKPDNNIEGY